MLNVVVFVFLMPSLVVALKYCYEGTHEVQRPDGYLMCDLCPEGAYMPEYDHRHTACYNCTKTQSHLEVASPCTRVHDAVITCVQGYYRNLPTRYGEKATCRKCTECQNAGRPCQTYSDTICCMYENSEVVLHQDGYLICKERPYLCRKGQYLDTSVNECLPCPSNTYMPSDLHVMTECLKCPHYDLPLHAEIIQSCNSTHAPVVACKKGFYMNHAMGYKDSSIGCSPCRDCNKASLYEGRACDGLHDTVYCPQPDMTVRDMPGGPLCEDQLELHVYEILTSATPPSLPPPPSPSPSSSPSLPAIYCGEDQYLYTNSTDDSVTCLPCSEGSYMNSSNHTSTSCENCTQLTGRQLPLSCLQTMPENSGSEIRRIQSMSPYILYPKIVIIFSLLFLVGVSIIKNYYCKSRHMTRGRIGNRVTQPRAATRNQPSMGLPNEKKLLVKQNTLARNYPEAPEVKC